MTLSSLIFDLLVVFLLAGASNTRLNKKEMGTLWVEVVEFSITLSKAGGLAVSTGWVIMDLVTVSNTAPGPGTLALGSITAVASFMVLLVELYCWWLVLPTAVERFNRAAQSQQQAQQDADNQQHADDQVHPPASSIVVCTQGRESGGAGYQQQANDQQQA
jgi:hypothetical protein